MPFEGKFYTTAELQNILGVSRQRIKNIATDHDWLSFVPGAYCAEDVENYLLIYRSISLNGFSVASHEFPNGVTWQEREAIYKQMLKQMEMEDDE